MIPIQRLVARLPRMGSAGAGALLATLLLLASTAVATAGTPPEPQVSVRELLRELVEINTAPSGGGTTEEAARRMAQRLIAGGFDARDVLVLGPRPELSALLARYRSERPTAPPVLLVAHLDVVEARREDWSFDPFTLVEQEGWLYGRGVWDNKAGAAILVASFLRLKAEGFDPRRDLIILLAADEETSAEGLQWILEHHRPLVEAEYALNTDAGYVLTANGRATEFRAQTAEKVYATYRLEVRNPGGHSSKPRADNAIYQLANLLRTLEATHFPVDLNDTTRAAMRHYLPHASAEERPIVRALVEGRTGARELSGLPAFPSLNAQARSTCVPTELAGGHAENALPQTARATVNCRLLPQAKPESARDALLDIADRHGATLTTVYAPMPSPPSPIDPELFGILEEVAGGIWPGIDIVPEMETGATDGAFLRNAGIPTYGVAAIESDPDDDRTHGRDERIGVAALGRATLFWYHLLRRIGGQNG